MMKKLNVLKIIKNIRDFNNKIFFIHKKLCATDSNKSSTIYALSSGFYSILN